MPRGSIVQHVPSNSSGKEQKTRRVTERGCASRKACEAEVVQIQQQDGEPTEEGGNVHRKLDRHGANNADALQQGNEHAKGAGGGEQHRCFCCHF